MQIGLNVSDSLASGSGPFRQWHDCGSCPVHRRTNPIYATFAHIWDFVAQIGLRLGFPLPRPDMDYDYWGTVERVKAASGIEQAEAAQTATREALQAIVAHIMPFQERTITGLVIKAQAMQACGRYVCR